MKSPSGSPGPTGLENPTTSPDALMSMGVFQVGSCTVVSAHPTTWSRLLTPVAKPWLPPSVGSACITPFSHTNPRQIWPVTLGKNAVQLHSSPSGSRSAVSAMPTTVPWSLSPGQTTLLLHAGQFGPPSVPRSRIDPSRHRAACRVLSPGKLEKPATQPRLLIAVPRLVTPPSDAENLVIAYCAFGVDWASASSGWVTCVSSPQPAKPAIRIVHEMRRIAPSWVVKALGRRLAVPEPTFS